MCSAAVRAVISSVRYGVERLQLAEPDRLAGWWPTGRCRPRRGRSPHKKVDLLSINPDVARALSPTSGHALLAPVVEPLSK